MKIGADTPNANTQNNAGAAPQQPYGGAQSQQQYAGAQAGAQAQAPHQSAGGLRRAMGRFAGPMSRQPQSEILAQLEKALRDEFTSSVTMKSVDWEILPLDYKNTSHISASSILVIISEKDNPKVRAYHALVLESDSAQQVERVENYNGSQYDVQKVTGDLVDGVMIAYWNSKVQDMYPQSEIRYADAEVVPRDFNIVDKAVLRSVAANASTAAYTELITHSSKFEYINLALVGKDTTLQTRTNHNQQEVTDMLGFPVRADFQIDFRSVPTQQQGQGANYTENVERVETYATVSGFLNLNYDPVVDQSNPWQAAQPRTPDQTQLYTAQLVLTSVESLDEINNAMQLLALSTSFSLLDQSQPYLQNLLPAHLAPSSFSTRRAGFDPKDVGALNYEAKMPDAQGIVDRVNTTDAATFGEREFYMYSAALIRRGAALSMDINECGPDTWSNRIFMAARQQNGEAYNALVGAAQAMTNGNFMNVFQKTSGQILTGNVDRIHTGYYFDNENVKHDLRNIDLLWMLNRFGKDNPNVGREWTETFTNFSRPAFVNLAIRRKMIEACASNVVFTGFAQRVTFHSDFISSLDQGIALTGLQVRAVASGVGSNWTQRSSTNLAQQGAINANFTSGFASAGYGGQQSQQYTGRTPGNGGRYF